MATGTVDDFILHLFSAIGTPYLFGGIDPFNGGADCIAQGSLVTTAMGDVPIESITEGDLVLTRGGYRPVIRSWLVRGNAMVVEAVLSNGNTLKGTPDHRVWTENRGWTALCELKTSDTLLGCQNPSTLMGFVTDDIQSRMIGQSDPTISEAEGIRGFRNAGRVTFTERFGLQQTAQSLRDMKSTTLTTTPSTITSEILMLSPDQSTGERARPSASSTTTSAPSVVLRSKRSRLPNHQFGSAVDRANNGTTITTSRMGTNTHPKGVNWFANIAGQRLRGYPGGNSAAALVPIRIERVRTSVPIDVYDLTVAGEHEFFASGVLVHNCSGLVYWAAQQCGVTVPRTTQGEWSGLEFVRAPDPGDLILFDVPSDGPPQPQHVMVYLGNDTAIQDPHTGAFVSTVSPVPNGAAYGLWIMGYRRIQFAPVVTPPPPPPPKPVIFKPLEGKVGNLNAPIVAVVKTWAGDGYTLVGADGGTFNYGKAPVLGSLAQIHLNAPIVDACRTRTGNGLYLVATDGGVFALGDAQFHGSMGGHPLNQPVIGITNTPNDGGYWLTAADGGIFAFGNAKFFGTPAAVA